MRKTMLKAICLITAALMLAAVIPLNVLAEPVRAVPAGYNEHDFNCVRSFLNATAEDGRSNGRVLSSNYDQWDPNTWGTKDGLPRFRWEQYDGELHLAYLDASGASCRLSGPLLISDCVRLAHIDCADNAIQIFHTENDPELTYLDYSNNSQILRSLDVSTSPKLEYCDCSNNGVQTVDMSSNPELTYLNCSGNMTQSLNVSNNHKLEYLGCAGAYAEEIDTSGCPLLRTLDAAGCYNVSEYDLSNNTLLEYVDLRNNFLTALDVSMLPELIELNVSGNYIEQLDVSHNPALKKLNCGGNSYLTALDVSNCPELMELVCESNEIGQLDVSHNPMLEVLICSRNPLTELDLSQNRLLYALECLYCELGTIDLRSNPELPLNYVRVSGSGTVGYSLLTGTEYDQGRPAFVNAFSTESNFVGWYDAAGELVSENGFMFFFDEASGGLTALFSDGQVPGPQPDLPGDVDGDGEVTVADALLALRASMGLVELNDEQQAAANVDGDEEITVADALLILRASMGLIEL